MKKNVKLILLGVGGLLIAAAAIYTLTAPISVPLTAIAPGTAELFFREQGVMAAERVVSVYPMAQGKLMSLGVSEGQAVKAGDVLCSIDTRPVELRISQSRSIISGYQAQMAAASGQTKEGSTLTAERLRLQNILIEQRAAEAERASTALERAKLLYDEGEISKAQLEDAQALCDQGATALAAAKQELAVIEAGGAQGDLSGYYRALIAAEQASIAQMESELENCTVLAPVDGVVTALYAADTNVISLTAPVAAISSANNGVIEAYLSTKDISSVKEGDAVELTLKQRSGDKVFKGVISRIGGTAEVRISSLGMEERRVKVEITPDAAGLAALKAGFEVDVKFLLYHQEGAMLVPKTALFKDGDKDMLWVVRNGKMQSAEVQLGTELRTERVIISGLNEGDYVVSDADNAALKNGARVKLP